ncbi:hypothetical protein D3C74_37720 [compost metagenome]
MKIEQLSLPRQLDMVFKELDEELSGLTSGIVFVQIRNNVIGKFGVKHHPIGCRADDLDAALSGLTAEQRTTFRNQALDALKLKRSWTHGEISYEFAVMQGKIVVDTTLESNYNMANLMIRYPRNTYSDANSETS